MLLVMMLYGGCCSLKWNFYLMFSHQYSFVIRFLFCFYLTFSVVTYKTFLCFMSCCCQFLYIRFFVLFLLFFFVFFFVFGRDFTCNSHKFSHKIFFFFLSCKVTKEMFMKYEFIYVCEWLMKDLLQICILKIFIVNKKKYCCYYWRCCNLNFFLEISNDNCRYCPSK